MTRLRLLAAAALLALFIGCAAVQPGADPLVVRTEQTESIAFSTFNLVVHVDDANRPFFMTNAPAFHQFAEWLRAPQMVMQSPTNTITLPRGAAMLWSLDATKRAYISSKTYSNSLVSAVATVEHALAEAQMWLTTTSTNH